MCPTIWDNVTWCLIYLLAAAVWPHLSVECHVMPTRKRRNGFRQELPQAIWRPGKKVLILTCRPDTSGAVPGAFIILLAQDADSAWTFTVRQVSLWLGRLVQVSGTSCKLHYFTQCRSDLTHLCVVAPAHLLYHAHFSIKSWLRKV